MPKNPLWKKGLACAIIVLFVGASAVSAVESNPLNKDTIKKSKVVSVRGDIAYAWALYDNYSGLVEFDLQDPGNYTPPGNGSGGIFITGSDFDLNGNWYAVAYGGGLYSIDINTYDMTFIANTIPLDSLVYDTTSGIWYASGGYPNGLIAINITTGATTYVGSYGISNIMISIMVDTSGNMFGYDVLFGGDSHLYSINKTNGAATVIGDMGHDFCYSQDGKFDRNNGILYLVAYDIGVSESYLATCDPATGAVTIIYVFSPIGIELDGLAIPYGNQRPRADFTWTPPSPLPGETILFNASASYDPDGYITLYEWDWNNDGVYEESHTTPFATHSWASPGNYVVTLRVTDNSSLTGRRSKTVAIVNHTPEPPVINGPINGTVNHEYTFSTNPITDPDGDSMYLRWDWGDGNVTSWLGPFASGQIISALKAWAHPGVYEIRAKLKDTYGAESNWSDPHTITIVDNKPPATPTITGSVKGKPGVTYLYNFVTTDPENDDVSYYIDWGDSTNTSWLGPYPSGVQKSASHSWSHKGFYTVKVKAKDIYGAESDWATLPVTMPYSYNLLFLPFWERLFERFPNAFPILRYMLGFNQ